MVIDLITFILALIGIRPRTPLEPMVNNEGMSQNPMDGNSEICYLSERMEAFHLESQLTIQVLQATLNYLTDALILPRAQGDTQPPIVVVWHNPDFYKALPVMNHRNTPDNSSCSDKDLDEGFDRRPIHKGNHLDHAEGGYRGKFQYGKENELYFFVRRNSEKSRMNRIVKQDYGFWRSTGNTIEKYVGEVTLQKGTLDFYIKNAEGNDKKTGWKMNEYSLASESSSTDQTSSSRGAKRKKVGRFALCKIYGPKTQVVENPMGGTQVGDGDASNDADPGPHSWAIEDLEAWVATIQRR